MEKKCELLLINARLIDVYSGEILENASIAINKDLIIGINDDFIPHTTIDLEGAYIAPSFIDSHVHIESSFLVPSEYSRLAALKGTGTVIADPHEIANVLGLKGIESMIESAKDAQLSIYFQMPSCVPASNFDTAGAIINASHIKKFIKKNAILGLGEVMNFPGVINGDKDLLQKIEIFKNEGKPIDGHAPLLSGSDLSTYILKGIQTDHECSNIDEAKEKLMKGLYILLRFGSCAKDLKNLISLVNKDNSRRFLLCTDDRHPEDILDEGHIDYLLRLCVESGLDPISAIRMATLNASECYKLHDRGAIAPGKKADLVVLESLTTFKIKTVFKNGKIIVKNGLLTEERKENIFEHKNTVNIKVIKKSDLFIQSQNKKIRVIRAENNSLITKELILNPKIENGNCVADLERDIAKLLVIERHTASGRIGKGFIQGLGLKGISIGSTISHDSHNMIISGFNDDDMLLISQRLTELKGGIAIAKNGKIVCDLALTCAGLMSTASYLEVIKTLKTCNAYFKNEGVNIEAPFMTLAFMALPVIPDLKLTDKGYVDTKNFKYVDLFV